MRRRHPFALRVTVQVAATAHGAAQPSVGTLSDPDHGDTALTRTPRPGRPYASHPRAGVRPLPFDGRPLAVTHHPTEKARKNRRHGQPHGAGDYQDLCHRIHQRATRASVVLTPRSCPMVRQLSSNSIGNIPAIAKGTSSSRLEAARVFTASQAIGAARRPGGRAANVWASRRRMKELHPQGHCCLDPPERAAVTHRLDPPGCVQLCALHRPRARDDRRNTSATW